MHDVCFPGTGGDPTAGHPSALAYAAGLAHALHVRVLCEGGAKPDKSVMVRCMTWYSASTRLVLPRPKRKSDEFESAFLRSLEAHEQKVDALKTCVVFGGVVTRWWLTCRVVRLQQVA